ncbi:uncharacterized protein LOC135809913 isoform X2 [Sycon ciliatum]|uniref:uncharacterized protein LOC135809913 isoform X2 n=1 Tax=Sycon ciliatum TaxID=27933 RepID=UPI0031F6223B
MCFCSIGMKPWMAVSLLLLLSMQIQLLQCAAVPPTSSTSAEGSICGAPSPLRFQGLLYARQLSYRNSVRATHSSCDLHAPSGSAMAAVEFSDPGFMRVFRLTCNVPPDSDARACIFQFRAAPRAGRAGRLLLAVLRPPGVSYWNITTKDMNRNPFSDLFAPGYGMTDHSVKLDYEVLPYPLPKSSINDSALAVKSSIVLRSCEDMDCVPQYCMQKCCLKPSDQTMLGNISGTYTSSHSAEVSYTIAHVYPHGVQQTYKVTVLYEDRLRFNVSAISAITASYDARCPPGRSSQLPVDTLDGDVVVQVLESKNTFYLCNLPIGRRWTLGLTASYKDGNCRYMPTHFSTAVHSPLFCAGASDNSAVWSEWSACSPCSSATRSRKVVNRTCQSWQPAHPIGLEENCTCVLSSGTGQIAPFCSVTYPVPPDCSNSSTTAGSDNGGVSSMVIGAILGTLVLVGLLFCVSSQRAWKEFNHPTNHHFTNTNSGMKSYLTWIHVEGVEKHDRTVANFFSMAKPRLKVVLKKLSKKTGRACEILIVVVTKELILQYEGKYTSGDIGKYRFLQCVLEKRKQRSYPYDVVALALNECMDETTSLTQAEYKKYCSSPYVQIRYDHSASTAAVKPQVQTLVDALQASHPSPIPPCAGCLNTHMLLKQRLNRDDGVMNILTLHPHEHEHAQSYGAIKGFILGSMAERLKDLSVARHEHGHNSSDGFDIFLAFLSQESVGHLEKIGALPRQEGKSDFALHDFFLCRRDNRAAPYLLVTVIVDDPGNGLHPVSVKHVQEMSGLHTDAILSAQANTFAALPNGLTNPDCAALAEEIYEALTRMALSTPDVHSALNEAATKLPIDGQAASAHNTGRHPKPDTCTSSTCLPCEQVIARRSECMSTGAPESDGLEQRLENSDDQRISYAKQQRIRGHSPRESADARTSLHPQHDAVLPVYSEELGRFETAM